MVQKLISGLQDPPAPVKSKGRKRKHPIEHALEANPDPGPDPDLKRQRTSPPPPAEVAFGEPAICSDAHTHTLTRLLSLAETWHCDLHYDKDIRVGPRVKL